MWKFLDQNSNPCYHSDPNRSSDNARSLTHLHHQGTPATNFFFFFLQTYLQHKEVPGPGVKLKLQLQLQACTTVTVTAVLDPSLICGDLYHSFWQCWILNPLNEAGD